MKLRALLPLFILSSVLPAQTVTMHYRSVYDPAKSYYTGDVVSYQGYASCMSLKNLNSGNDPLTSANYWFCSSRLTPQVIGGSSGTATATSTTTTLVASNATLVFGSSEGLTATVAPSAASGTVSYYDGNTLLGTATVSGGSATYTTTGLSVGTHSLSAVYGGDATYASSTSNTVSVTVTSPPASGATWYVRPDGGTRYTANYAGQCDGLADAPYPGTGTNQHCAFKEFRWLYQDGTYSASTNNGTRWNWVIAPGDTVIVRGSIGTSVSYGIGWDNPNGALDPVSGLYYGMAGDNGASGPPPVPSGTAAQHTRILGENYASCHTASAKTQLHGRYGVRQVLDLSGVSYVDVACFDITDFSSCGLDTNTKYCNKNLGTLDDYAVFGLRTTGTTTNTTVTDVHIHGVASDGGYGPTGDNVVMDYVDWIGNADSGWNTDDGTNGHGTLTIKHFNISWNGCPEQYGSTAALPYADCTDDVSGGYGDGWGTRTSPSVPPWNVTFLNGVASYNTQDGLDALHVTGTGSSVTIKNVLAYGNMGNQLKVGGTSGSVINSEITQNCRALQQAIPGTIAGYNSRLSNFCRAAGNAVALSVGPGTKVTFDDNTVYAGNGSAGLLVVCEPTQVCDSTSKIDYRNNIMIGNGNPPRIDNQAVATLFTNTGSLFSNNLTFATSSTCPMTGETNSLCVDPQLTDETFYAYGYANMTPLSSSPAKNAGVTITGIDTDYNGTPRTSPPTIGAVQ